MNLGRLLKFLEASVNFLLIASIPNLDYNALLFNFKLL